MKQTLNKTLKRSSGSNSCPDLNQVNVGSSPGATFRSCPFNKAKTSLASIIEKEIGISNIYFFEEKNTKQNIKLHSFWFKKTLIKVMTCRKHDWGCIGNTLKYIAMPLQYIKMQYLTNALDWHTVWNELNTINLIMD